MSKEKWWPGTESDANAFFSALASTVSLSELFVYQLVNPLSSLRHRTQQQSSRRGVMTSKIWRSVLSLLLFLALPVLSQAQQSQSIVASAPRLPLEFEPNQGQSPRDVLWQARAGGYDVFVRQYDVALMLRHSKDSAPAMLSLRWVGGAPHGVAGEGRLEGISNYFRGNN